MSSLPLPNVRISFCEALFEAKPFKPGDKPKFKSTFLIQKGSALDKQIRAAINAAAVAKWGAAKAPAILKSIENNPNKMCYQDGDSKPYDGYKGMMALTAGNSVKPTVIDNVIDEATGKPRELTASNGRIYAGCYVDGIIELFAYTNSGNGISASLGGVRFNRDGDAFSGGRPASMEDFETLDNGAGAGDLA